MAITLDVVNSILKTYKQDHQLKPMDIGHFPVNLEQIPIRTQHLRPYIEERGAVDEILIHDIEHVSNNVIAQVQVIDNVLSQLYHSKTVANIYLSKGLNLCWRRFATCKEMYHCMLYEESTQRVTTLNQLKELLYLLANDTTPLTGASAQFSSEKIAELYALETLFPVEFRKCHQADYTSGALAASDLATMYRIPQAYVVLAFEPRYLRSMEQLRGELLHLD